MQILCEKLCDYERELWVRKIKRDGQKFLPVPFDHADLDQLPNLTYPRDFEFRHILQNPAGSTRSTWLGYCHRISWQCIPGNQFAARYHCPGAPCGAPLPCHP